MSSNRNRSSSWQERLQDHCRSAQLHPPVFNIVSDRRGGRTAWSSTVTIPSASSHPHSQQTLQARYWYDGQYVHNAKEDAAEVALRTLTNSASSTSPGGSVGGTISSGEGFNGGRNGLSPGANHASAAWGISEARLGPGHGQLGGWPRSPPAGRWGSIGGG